MLYVKALNSIYRIIKAAILFYKKFVGNITTISFKINPYDPCFTNNLISGRKITMVWHVDYLKVGHESKKIFTKMVKWIA